MWKRLHPIRIETMSSPSVPDDAWAARGGRRALGNRYARPDVRFCDRRVFAKGLFKKAQKANSKYAARQLGAKSIRPGRTLPVWKTILNIEDDAREYASFQP
jgi:hypothetical protein